VKDDLSNFGLITSPLWQLWPTFLFQFTPPAAPFGFYFIIQCTCLALYFFDYLENIGFVYPAMSMFVIEHSLLY
jgi:hypothetical protein